MLLPEDLGSRHPTVVKVQDQVVVAAVGDRVVARRHLQARGVVVDQERGDELFGAPRSVLFPGGREQDRVVG